MRAAGLVVAVGVALVLAACARPAETARDGSHATWCGTSPPSGYCSVPETGK
jgi:hypothetical protein